jgi:hypothetical protein
VWGGGGGGWLGAPFLSLTAAMVSEWPLPQPTHHTWDGATCPRKHPRAPQVNLDWLASQGLDTPLWLGEFGIQQGVGGHDDFIVDWVQLYSQAACTAAPTVLGRTWWEFKDSGPFSAVDPNDTSVWYPWVDLVVGAPCGPASG